MQALHTKHGLSPKVALDAVLSQIRRDRNGRPIRADPFEGLAETNAYTALLRQLTYAEVCDLLEEYDWLINLVNAAPAWLDLEDDEANVLFDANWVGPQDWHVLQSVRSVSLSFRTIADLAPLAVCRKLDFYLCKFTGNLGDIAGVEYLSFTSCQLRNVAPLGRCRHLKIMENRRANFETLGQVEQLELIECDVQDASPFAGVKRLSLRENPKLRDVSALGDQTYLDISETRVRDIRSLSRVNCLVANNLRLKEPNVEFTSDVVVMRRSNLQSFFFLEKVPHVDVSGARNAVLPESLVGHDTLDASSCGIVDVVPLAATHDLYLANNAIDDVSALGSQRILDLSANPVVEVGNLASVPYLDLSGTLVEDVGALGWQQILIIRGTQVVDVSSLASVPTLDASGLERRQRLVGNRENTRPSQVVDFGPADPSRGIDMPFESFRNSSRIQNRLAENWHYYAPL
jgi:hypothetical protein